MACIKCGRETEAGNLLCPDCSRAMTEGAKAPAHSAPIPAPRPHPARSPKPQETPAAPSAAAPSGRRWLFRITLIVAILALAYIALSFSTSLIEQANYRSRAANLTMRENELDQLEAQVSSLGLELAQAQAQNQSLTEQLEERDRLLDAMDSSTAPDHYGAAVGLTQMADENAQLYEMIERLEAENDTLRAKSDFVDNYAVFIENDGSRLYHAYDCPEFTKLSFWVYSKKLAQRAGYSPCPTCQG